MNPQALAASQKIAADLLANVTPDQLDQPTPCANWNVGQLIDHMVGAQYWALGGMTGQPSTETGEGSSTGDFCAAFDAAAQQALAAFSEPGALGKMVNPGFGDMPGAALLGLAATDTFTHAWDLAKATGQDTNLDPQLAAAFLEGSKQAIQPAFRSETGEIFGPEQQAPDGASSADQLAAFPRRKA